MEKLKQAIEANTLDGQNGVWVHPADMWNETVERSGKTYRRFCRLDRIERVKEYEQLFDLLAGAE